MGEQSSRSEELALATGNFSPDSILYEGSHFTVYKGILHENSQLVAVKKLGCREEARMNDSRCNRYFLFEVLTLDLLHHRNLVSMVGYCSEGSHRLIVYEFSQLGPLKDYLFGAERCQKPLDWNKGGPVLGSSSSHGDNFTIVPRSAPKPLDWNTRIKIAIGVAQGLEYLHNKANPPVIHRDLTPSNILLDEDFNPRLSNLGLAKLVPVGHKLHASTNVVGTIGYMAPDYVTTGQLSVKSDIYSFGVVLLELMSGRRAVGILDMNEENPLASWVQAMRKDLNRLRGMADPLLQGNYPMTGLDQVASITAMCLQEKSADRPSISDVVAALSTIGVSSTELHEASTP